MLKQDKIEIQQFFISALDAFKREEALERKLIMVQLSRIEDSVETVDQKVTKTNGSVLRHTDQINKIEKELPHTAEGCPQREIIRILFDNYKVGNGVKKWKLLALTFGAGLFGVISGIIATMEFIMKYKP